MAIVSEDLNVTGDSRLLAQLQKACKVANTELIVSGIKSCLEMDDIRILEISENCSKVTKHVCC